VRYVQEATRIKTQCKKLLADLDSSKSERHTQFDNLVLYSQKETDLSPGQPFSSSCNFKASILAGTTQIRCPSSAVLRQVQTASNTRTLSKCSLPTLIWVIPSSHNGLCTQIPRGSSGLAHRAFRLQPPKCPSAQASAKRVSETRTSLNPCSTCFPIRKMSLRQRESPRSIPLPIYGLRIRAQPW